MSVSRRSVLGFVPLFVALLALAAAPAAAAKKASTNLRTVRAPAIADPFLFTPAVKPPAHREGQLIVRFKPGTSESARSAANSRRGARLVKKLLLPDTELVSIDPSRNEKSVARAYGREHEVEYAEPNFVYTLASYYPVASDFSQVWALDNTGQEVNGTAGSANADMDVVEAWDKTRGSNAVVVGVADSGVDYAHPDLASNIWNNPGEMGSGRDTNGIDDDLNGRVDDWRGFDFVSSGDNDPSDPIGHGTAVASTIGARSTVLHGVSPTVRLAPLRTCDQTGFCNAADIEEAFAYAGRNDFKVVSAALSGPNFSQTLLDTINLYPQTLYATAAGNGGGDGASDNVDAPGAAEYPCSYTAPNVLCVAATDQNDELAGFSNYGGTSVDVAAPGVNVRADWPSNRVAYQNGTSVATGYAAGAAALAWSPSLAQSATAVRARLIDNADDKAGLSGRLTSDGRINVAAALPPAPAGPMGSLDTSLDSDGKVETDVLGCEDTRDVAVQPDGKIVVVGATYDCGAGEYDFMVIRYNGDGSLDSTFGSNGKVVTDFGGFDFAAAVAVDPATGKIVVAGSSNATAAGDQIAVARYNPNGTLDPGLDADGKVIHDLTPGAEGAEAVLVEGGSTIVLAGYRNFGGIGSMDMTIGRLNATGTFDAGFNGGNWASTDFAGVYGQADTALDVKRQPDGKYVVAGRAGSSQPSTGANFALARYTSAGILDTSFDGDGKVVTDLGGSLEDAVGLALDAGGTPDIVAAGYSNSGEGGKIAFTTTRDGNSEVYTMTPQGLSATNITNNAASDAQPRWTPSGQLLLFTSNRGGNENVWSVGQTGSGPLQWTTNGASDSQPSPAPDPGIVGFVFVSDRDGNREIYKRYGTETRLTNNAGVDQDPDWSPDGTKIAFASNRDGDYDIYTMNASNGSGVTNVTNNTTDDRHPIWSPDGSKIAFRTTRDGNGEIYTMTPAGGSPTNLTNNPADEQLPSWSGNGQQVVFQSNRDGNNEIYRMNSNGTPQTRLTNNSADDNLSDWQPLATMAVARYNPDGSLDASFGAGGKEHSDFPGGAEAADVAIQDNPGLPGTGNILVAGWTSASPTGSAFARLRPDGNLDGQFGTGGHQTVSFPDSEQLTAVAIQPDGNIVSAGTSYASDDVAVARLVGGQMTVDVEPNAQLLRTGHAVAVSGSGFAPATTLNIDQCRPSLCVGQGTVATDASGSFTTTVNVDETLDGSATTCPDPSCTIRVGPQGTSGQQLSTTISFSRNSALELTPSAGSISQGQAITVGTPISLTALVRGSSAGSPTGNVNFDSCGPVQTPATCSEAAGVDRGTKALAAINATDSSATSDPITFATPGRYCFRAAYAGDVSYRQSSDESPATCINVRQPSPALQATEDYFRTPNNADLSVSAGRGLLQNDLWPAGASVSAVLDTNPLHGALTLNPDGSFTYNPDNAFAGTDDFTYIVQQSGGGQSLPQTVTIDVSATADLLDGTRFRGTRFRGTRFREIDQVTVVTYSQCRSRFVWVNPQITIPEPVTLQVTAALYDAAGNRLATTDGYVVNDAFYGDPFQPTVLTWPVWTQPVPAQGAYAEVYVVANAGTVDEYEVTSSVLCGT